MPDVQIAHGHVNPNGSRDYGDGRRWTSRRLSVGKYRIDFGNDFKNQPAITLTAENSGALPLIATMDNESNADRRGFAVLQIMNAQGQSVDAAFHFIAVGED